MIGHMRGELEIGLLLMEKFPEYSINKNGHTRLRFINASNARILSFESSLDGMNIISIDGMSLNHLYKINLI